MEVMSRIKVAVLDNGVSSDCGSIDIKNRYYINEFMECKKEPESSGDNLWIHGTNCAAIIARLCKECELFSIRILDQYGMGSIQKLEPALSWCLKHHIQVVNLSFGSTHFQDRMEIRKIINHYVNNGMIIVAASSNDGYKTFPASFSNVIGVAAGNNLCTDKNLQSLNGIDFLAPSEHKLEYEWYSIKLRKSNSYAAPFVTALLSNEIMNCTNFTVHQLRERLITKCGAQHRFYYNPDWVEKAWVSDKCMKSKADFYFDTTELYKAPEESDADTLIMKDTNELIKYQNAGKNLIYLGNEDISPIDKIKNIHFWSKEQKVHQIFSAERSIAEIEIPVIVCRVAESQDEMYWLSQFRDYFYLDGYHAFIVSKTIESILYEFEYIPEQMCSLQNREFIRNFLFWQTYYNQSDILIFSYTQMKDGFSVIESPEVFINIYGKDETWISVSCSKRLRVNRKVELNDNTAIEKIYMIILQIMMEGTNE